MAATFPDAEKYVEPAQAFVESPADSQVVNGYQFFKVFDDIPEIPRQVLRGHLRQ